MALSNWETMAWDDNGQSCPGYFERDGVRITIYKNWVYLYDEKVGEPKGDNYNGADTYPVMQILEGNFNYKNFDITAKRDKQQAAIFLVVGYRDKSKKYDEEGAYTRFFGVGCASWDSDFDTDEREWDGVSPKTFSNFLEWFRWLSEEDFIKVNMNNDEVTSLVKAFENSPLRYNQGDVFFTGQTNLEASDVVTRIGEANPSIISILIEGDKTPNEPKDDDFESDNTRCYFCGGDVEWTIEIVNDHVSRYRECKDGCGRRWPIFDFPDGMYRMRNGYCLYVKDGVFVQ